MFNPAILFLVSSAAPITFQLPSTFGNLHDDHILYPIVKVLYALHTLLERIAASKTLEGREEERGRDGEIERQGERAGKQGVCGVGRKKQQGVK